MAPTIEKILGPYLLGEGPHWDVATQSLYYSDIYGYTMNRYDPVSKKNFQVNLGTFTSFTIPVEGKRNQFLVSLGPELSIIDWDGVSNNVSKIEKIASVPDSRVRFNDGKVDPHGRLWSGTMGTEFPNGGYTPRIGNFYSLEKTNLQQHFSDVDISNGLAWNESLNKMYYIDSGNKTIDQFDYDGIKGTISNRQPVFSLEKHNISGLPDGQTIDVNGNLWAAVYSSSIVVKVDPRRPETLLETIEFPAKYMSPKVERVLENFILAEGPHWDAATQNLYLVDIFGNSIHRYDPTTGQHFKADLDSNVSLIVPIENRKDQFVISHGHELAIITWDGVSEKVSKLELLASVPDRQVRFNDGKADAFGRLWTGTMAVEKPSGEVPPNKGSFYSYDKGQLKQHFDEVHISNGLTWNLELGKMYYIDSGRRVVDQFDYDGEKGTISNRKTIFTLGKNNVPGFPDGQTIDKDGNLWVAVFGGSRVIKIDPRKPETLLETIELPASQVTSVAFGGPELDELYITTARSTMEGKLLDPPVHGAIYKATNLGTKGLPGWNVKF